MYGTATSKPYFSYESHFCYDILYKLLKTWIHYCEISLNIYDLGWEFKTSVTSGLMVVFKFSGTNVLSKNRESQISGLVAIF
jgi:hypothetical protein